MMLRLVAMALALTLPAAAQATEWEVLGHLGAGRFFGRGADSNRFGLAGAISGGPRVHPMLSIRAYFQIDSLRLRKVDDLEAGSGESFVFAVGPHYHPLGKRYAIQPYIGALVGIAYTRVGTVDGRAEVEARSRAVAVGATLGVVWALDKDWGVGASVLALPLIVDKACIHVVGDVTSCDAGVQGLNLLGSFAGVLSYSF